jgi:hypothetical protein
MTSATDAMVEVGRLYRHPRRHRAFGPSGHSRPRRSSPADLDPAAIDALAPRLDPAAQAIVGLYRACRLEGERYAECFARLGAPTYAAMLHEALQGTA